jgi:dipeptidyl aminopeptidase/acylaminoacyl peptidase
VSAPILLIHGAADDNTGTFPVQSERFYAALKGNGKTARLVMLPAEPHGYRARESNGHVLFEMVTWLDKWVKGKPKA